MSRIERYIGRSGKHVELRYQVDVKGVEFLDEIVAENIHVEIMDDDVCWADIDGIRVTWSAVKRGVLRFQAEADDAIGVQTTSSETEAQRD